MNLLQISPDIKFLIYYKRFSLLPFLYRKKRKDDRKILYISFKYWHFPFVAKFIAKVLQFNLLIEIFLLT